MGNFLFGLILLFSALMGLAFFYEKGRRFEADCKKQGIGGFQIGSRRSEWGFWGVISTVAAVIVFCFLPKKILSLDSLNGLSLIGLVACLVYWPISRWKGLYDVPSDCTKFLEEN